MATDHNFRIKNGLQVGGTIRIDSAGKFYPANIQNTGGPISFLNGSSAQGISARDIYAGTTYANRTAAAGTIDALNGFKVAGTTVIDASRHATVATGAVSGKFAVMATSVHGSYDFYNNGTTYLNGAAIIDDSLDLTGSNRALKIAGTTVIDASRNLTNIAAATIAGNVLINGAHDNNGNAKLAVESGSSYPQISLYSDQVQLGNTSMNYNFKIYTDGSGAKLTAWNSDITIGTVGSNTGSASARNIIFSPQISGTAASTERMRLRGADGILEVGQGLGGLVIDSGGNKEAVEGRRYNWYLHGMGTQTDYYKVATITVGTGLYKALAMKVVIESQLGNFGNTASIQSSEMNITYYRSGGTQDDNNNAVIYGENPTSHTLRVMKTATGTYELQIKQDTSYRDATVKIQVLSTNGGSIEMHNGFVVGSSSGTEYTPSTNTGAKNLFPGTVKANTFEGSFTGTATGLSGTPNISVGTISSGNITTSGNIILSSGNKVIFGGDDTYNAHLQYTDNGSGDHFLSIKTEHNNTITERAKFHAGTGAITFDGAITTTGHIQQNNANEIRSKDTGGSVRTIMRVNSSNELEYGWSGNGKVKIMGGGSYTERFSIGTDGNATFSGTISSGAITSSGTVTGTQLKAATGSTTAAVLKLEDTGVATYDVSFPDTGTMLLGVNDQSGTTSDKVLKLHNAGSGTFGLNVEGNITLGANSGAIIQFGTSANHKIVSGSGYAGGDMDFYTTDDMNLRTRWARFWNGATEHGRIAYNGSWVTGNFNVKSGNIQINGTTVIDSSRNISNIGTISSGAITSNVSDGTAITLQRSGSTAAKFGVASGPVGFLVLNDTTSNNVAAIKGTSAAILPSTNAGADKHGTMDLGSSSVKFRNLFLSGDITVDDITATGTTTVADFKTTGTALLGGTKGVMLKSLTSSFSHGTANQYARVNLGNNYFSGTFKVKVQGTYSNQNTVGYVEKIWSVGLNPNNSVWRNTVERVDHFGAAASNFTIGNIAWDGSQYYFDIYHIVSTGNNINIDLELHSHNTQPAMFSTFDGITVSSVTTGTIPTAFNSVFASGATPFRNTRLKVADMIEAPDLTLTGLSAQNSEATAVMINGSGVVGTRELGSNAFNSTTIPSSSSFATLSGSNSFTNSYNEFGNGTGSVSNDGSWNARVNVAGTSHARFDVKSVSDGIIGTMYAHSGHNGPRFGSISNHQVDFIANSSVKATLSTGGSLSTTAQGTLWGASNDGSGSGLDSDTVDAKHATDLLHYRGVATGDWDTAFTTGTGKTETSGLYQVNNITSGSTHSNYPTAIMGITPYQYGGVFAWNLANHTFKLYSPHVGNLYYQSGWNNDEYSGWRMILDSGNYSSAGIWGSANDGSGSGLDADTVDGIQGSALAPKASPTFTGTVTLPSTVNGPSNDTSLTGVTTGWHTIASFGGSRSAATIELWDSESGRHNFVKAEVGWSYGQGSINILNNVRHGTRTIARMRLMYNTGDQTYGGARLEVYLENWTSSHYLRLRKVNRGGRTGWADITWAPSSGSVSGYAQYGEVIETGSTIKGTFGTSGKLIAANGLDLYNGSQITLHTASSDGISTERGFIDAEEGGHLRIATSGGENIKFQDGGVGGDTNLTILGTGEMVKEATERFTIKAHSNSWDGGMRMYSQDGTDIFQIHPDNNGYMYVDKPWYFTSTPHIGTIGNTVWHTGNDGSGSGLDADTVDGVNSGSFLRSDAADTFTGTLTMGTQKALVANNYGRGVYGVYSSYRHQHVWSMGTAYNLGDDGQSAGNLYGISYTHTNLGTGYGSNAATGLGHQLNGRANGTLQWALGEGIWSAVTGNVWGASNDGAGSGLDADTLDGMQSGASGASIIMRTESNGYSQLNNWTQVGGAGLYSATVNGFHFYPNQGTSYGTARINGARNGYTGIMLDAGGDVVIGMYDSSGNGGIYGESTSGWEQYYHRANACLGINGSATSSSYSLYVTGAIYSTADIVAYSDRRAKENIITIDSALEKVNQLRGVYYNKIDNEDKEREIGFIAQEVNEVAPELVTHAEDIDQYGMKYGNTTALLVEAVKELTQQVKDLKQEVEELKNG